MTHPQRLALYLLLIAIMALALYLAAVMTPFDATYNRQQCINWVVGHPNQPVPSWCRRAIGP